MIVQWGSCLSNAFFVTNGVRQGGILSPVVAMSSSQCVNRGRACIVVNRYNYSE